MFKGEFKELRQLRVNMDQIGVPGNCPWDNAPARRALVLYEYRADPVGDDNVGFAVYRKLPGFECTRPKDECDLTWPDTGVYKQFLESVAVGLARIGYPDLGNHLAWRQKPLDLRSFSPLPPGVSI